MVVPEHGLWPMLSVGPLAYVGPGAGFAVVGSFAVLLAAVLLVLSALLLLPFRLLGGILFRSRRRGKGTARRVVLLGLDGLDPRRVRRMMEKGELPHLRRLAEVGAFADLRTTCPPISPVAWSSFATGVNPGKHNIFDFLDRDRRTYLPHLSSCRIRTWSAPGLLRRVRTEITLGRRSVPFWKILGEHGVFSGILRVPITFPPEAFRGVCLAGQGTPDVRGTQSSYTLYESAPSRAEPPSAGVRIAVRREGRTVRTQLPGPGSTVIPLEIRLDADGTSAVVRVSGQAVRLVPGRYSEWVPVSFRVGWRRARGICRFLLQSTDPVFRLYVTPLHMDPERPSLPLTHPAHFSVYLAKLHGRFGTLGLAEDTGALLDGAIDEAAFLRQALDLQAERETLLVDLLGRIRTGFCACVFELPDRVQHMFLGREHTGPDLVDGAYRRMDALVGRVAEKIGAETVLFVVSDHGFTTFRRGVNWNAWLRDRGWLARRPGAAAGEYLRDVDWSRTKAYSFGLSGIYLNRRGREGQGIVEPGEEADALKAEIGRALLDLRDPATGTAPVRSVYDSADIYTGPYRDNGPDLVVGCAEGYRASWESAVGRTDGEAFTDNTRAWSGDHCVDRDLVPGVFLCNRAVDLGAQPPDILDLAPTILRLFGIDPPRHMDGRVLAVSPAEEEAGKP